MACGAWERAGRLAIFRFSPICPLLFSLAVLKTPPSPSPSVPFPRRQPAHIPCRPPMLLPPPPPTPPSLLPPTTASSVATTRLARKSARAPLVLSLRVRLVYLQSLLFPSRPPMTPPATFASLCDWQRRPYVTPHLAICPYSCFHPGVKVTSNQPVAIKFVRIFPTRVHSLAYHLSAGTPQIGCSPTTGRVPLIPNAKRNTYVSFAPLHRAVTDVRVVSWRATGVLFRSGRSPQHSRHRPAGPQPGGPL